MTQQAISLVAALRVLSNGFHHQQIMLRIVYALVPHLPFLPSLLSLPPSWGIQRHTRPGAVDAPKKAVASQDYRR